MKTCPRCATQYEEDILLCPNCKTIAAEFGAQEREQREREIEALSAEVLDRITKKLKFRITWRVAVAFAFVAGVLSTYIGISVRDARRLVQQHIDEAIAAQFNDAKVKDTFERVVSDRGAAMMDKELRPAIENAKAEMNQSLGELRHINDYSLLALKANAGDRGAWDELGKIGKDATNPLSNVAELNHQAVMDQHNPLAYTMFGGPWPLDPRDDPTKAPLSHVRSYFTQVQKKAANDWQQRAFIVQSIANRQDLSKRDRTQFVFDALDTDPNLEVVMYAGVYFKQLTGLSEEGYKPLAVDYFRRWWPENKEKLK